MVTITAQGRNRPMKPSSRLNPIIFHGIWLSLVGVSSLVTATEIEIKPQVSSTYTYIANADFDGVSFEQEIEDGHQAITLTPSIVMTANGPVWQGSWQVAHTSIKQLQSEFDDTAYNNISLANQFSFNKDRVVFALNANRTNQNVDQRFAGVSDPIFGQDEYIDVDTFTGSLTLKNKASGDWRNSLSMSWTKTDFDEQDLAQTDTTSTRLLKGDSRTVNAQLAYGKRMSQVKGVLSLSGTENKRDVRGKQQVLTAYANLGIPIWNALDFVVTGRASRNSIDNLEFAQSNLDNESYGAGLAWRFGQRSYFEVTYNKDSQGQTRFSEEDFKNDFVAYKLVIEPSKHTSVSLENSRRFYGEANSFSLEHNASRWRTSIKYSEDLGSTSRLQSERVSAGIFACFPDSLVRENCAIVDRLPETPVGNLVFFEFFDTNYLFVEELTLTKGLNATFAYEGRKSTLTLSYNESERQFLERENDELGNVQDSESMSLSYNHRMSRRTSLVATANHTKVTSNGSDGVRKGTQYSLGLERRLTRKATGKINVRHFDNDGRSGTQSRKDTRLEIQYSYQF